MSADSGGTRLRFGLMLPAVYGIIALVAWIDFARTNPDGLANLGLMLVVFPIAVLDLTLRSAETPGSSVFIPSHLGYYPAHALFFWVSVACIAALLFGIGLLIDRRRQR